jgi:hypothetical protein
MRKTPARAAKPKPATRSKPVAAETPTAREEPISAKSEELSELDQAMLSVWRQALLERARRVQLGQESYSVRRTAKRGLAQVDFEVAGQPIRGLEQNPQTNSRWARLARQGAKVMQFLSGGQYIAAISDGKITHYSRR